VTRDSRWNSLSCNLLHEILDRDDLAIGSETELLGLIERWNSDGHKSKDHIIRLVDCYRVSDDKSYRDYLRVLTNLGFSDPALIGTPNRKPARDNLTTKEREALLEQMAEEERNRAEEEEKRKRERNEFCFIKYFQGNPVQSGFSFILGPGKSIVQNKPIRNAGTYRLRLAYSQNEEELWNSAHDVFSGIIFGRNKFHGFICGLSPYESVYRVQTYTSGAPKPGPPTHLTGNGTKMEFDLELGVNLQRVNRIVDCSLSVIANNTIICMTEFQIRSDTLADDTGLKFQIIGTIPPPGVVNLRLAWVAGV